MAGDERQRAVERFAAELAELRLESGKPSFAHIHGLSKKRARETSGGQIWALPRTTAWEAVQGRRLPTLATVLAFVDACRLAADEHGARVDGSRFDAAGWQRRWQAVEAMSASLPSPGSSVPSADSGLGSDTAVAEDADELDDFRDYPDVVLPPRSRRSREYSHRVALFTAAIGRSATEHLEDIHLRHGDSSERNRRGKRGVDLLQERVETLLERYDRPAVRIHGDTLVFADIYFEAASVTPYFDTGQVDRLESMPDQPAEKYFAALIAAEVEFRSPLRLTYTQQASLAEVYERVGAWMAGLNQFTYAALSYKRAAILHHQNEDIAGKERCELARLRAQRRTKPPGFRRLPSYAADALCGYGYRPTWLLNWMAAVIVMCAMTLWLIAGLPLHMCFQWSVTNFFSPVSIGDTQGLTALGKVLLNLESVAGTLTTLTFVVMLSRRWSQPGLR